MQDKNKFCNKFLNEKKQTRDVFTIEPIQMSLNPNKEQEKFRSTKEFKFQTKEAKKKANSDIIL